MIAPDQRAAIRGGSRPDFLPQVESKERELGGQVLIITGAGSENGIGAKIVEFAAARGAKLLFTATQRSEPSGLALAASLRENGSEAEWIAADLTDEKQAEAVVGKAVALYGRVDGLIHCVGKRFDGIFLRLSDSAWQQGFQVNTMSAVHMARAVIAQIVRQDRGQQEPRGARVLLISSVSEAGMGGQSIYSAMKAAMRGLVGALAMEYGGRKIKVNAIAPGLVPGTNMTKDLTDEQQAGLLQLTQTERPVTREEVAQAAVFFMSPRSGDFSGQVVPVLGGEDYTAKDLREKERPLSFKYFSEDPLYADMNGGVVANALKGVQNGNFILDLACANGANTKLAVEHLRAAGTRTIVIGVDINVDDLAEAKAAVPEAVFLEGDATNLQLPPNVFHRALFMNVIHEIQGKSVRTVDSQEREVENKDLALQELFRVCRGGAEVVVVSGFTSEVFDFESEGENRLRASRLEWMKHGKIREASFRKLGEERDKSKLPFEVLSTAQYVEKLLSAGFEVAYVEACELPFTSESMRRIGEDKLWLEGIFQDMANTGYYSLREKRDAYLAVITELETTHQKEHPDTPLLFRRKFVIIKARKPLELAA